MLELLRAQPLFAELPPEAVEVVVDCARNAVFDRGELLLSEGSAASTLYLVRRGSVAIESHAPGRGPLVVQTLGPGKVIGWSWLVPPFRWDFDARAVTPVGALAIDGACLREKADTYPAFGYSLLRRASAMLLERLQATRIQLLDIYGHES